MAITTQRHEIYVPDGSGNYILINPPTAGLEISSYNPGEVFYIKTDLPANTYSMMIYGYIHGNGYSGKPPIHVDFEAYNYTADSLMSCEQYDATNAIGAMSCIRGTDNLIYFKVTRGGTFQTYKIFIYQGNQTNEKNHAISISTTAPEIALEVELTKCYGIHSGNLTSITKVGTITAGTWNGTAIAAAYIGNHSTDKLTSGTLPVARGGTGITSNPSMLIDLGSTDADSVFADTPRPGIIGTLGIDNGGTGATTAAAARTNLELGTMAVEAATDYIKTSVLSDAFDIMYSSAANTPTRLAANTTSTKKFLRMTGTGSVGAAPAWDTVTKSDVGLGNVENTALSTWTGSNKITTLGTIATGTWNGTTIGAAYGGTGKTTLKDAANALINALDTGSSALTANDYVITQYVGGGTTTTTYHRRPASAIRVGGLLNGRKLQVALGSTTAVTFNGTADVTDIPISGTLAVGHGGTGATTFTSGAALIGNGTSAIGTRAIYTRSSAGTLDWGTKNDALLTKAAIAYWNGAYSGTASNIAYVGTIKGGTWNGSAIPVANGGTGATTAAGARTNLGILQNKATNTGSKSVAANSEAQMDSTSCVAGTWLIIFSSWFGSGLNGKTMAGYIQNGSSKFIARSNAPSGANVCVSCITTCSATTNITFHAGHNNTSATTLYWWWQKIKLY